MLASALQVEVAYATARRQWLIALSVPKNATVADAIAIAAVNFPNFPNLPNLPNLEGTVGIFARACQLNDVLKDGDRVEIYRPLIADPMVQRRARAVVANKSVVKNAAAKKAAL